MFYYVQCDNSIHRRTGESDDGKHTPAVTRAELVRLVSDIYPATIPSHRAIARPDHVKSNTDHKNYTRRQRNRCARRLVLNGLKKAGCLV